MNEYQVKAAVRKRDDGKCRDCGMSDEEHQKEFGKSLEVHRVIPGADYRVDICVLLCRKCHQNKPKTVQKAFWMDSSQSGALFIYMNLYNPDDRRIHDGLAEIADRQEICIGSLIDRILLSYIERASADDYCI